MSKNRNEAMLATDAFLFSFPVSSTLAVGANSALPVGAVDLGIFNSDGMELTPTKTVNNIFGSNFGLIRTTANEGMFTIAGTVVQTNDENLELITGSKKSTEGIYAWNTNNTGGVKSFVLDMVDTGTNKKVRWYAPEAEITEVSGLQVVDTGLLQYAITITCYASVWQGEIGHVHMQTGDYSPVVSE